MSITVTVENDMIKLPVHVPDGTRLEITLPGEGGAVPAHRHAWMQKYIGAVKDGPDDVAAEQRHESRLLEMPVIGSAAPVAENPHAWMLEYAGCIEGPEDFAAEHDHYIHGTPKRAG